jgi:hypothetical protein
MASRTTCLFDGLIMEAASNSEKVVSSLCQTKRRNIPEDSNIYSHRLENLKSHQDVVKLRTVKFAQLF